ncbi:hypothetical protein DFH28DRAFT_203513 [Melampsora americana]|nr:hypothetical protein DFH28DRAFT_203513 [Melampsora americana]
MYQNPEYLLWIFIVVFLQLPLSGRTVSNRVLDLSMLESTQKLHRPTIEYSRPVHKSLLNQDHLNTWRDLRTIEELARHRKEPHIFRKKVEDFVEQLSRNPTCLIDGNQLKLQDIEQKPRYTANESLYILLYQLKQVLKAHSPQMTHQEIDHISERFFKNFKRSFTISRKSMKGTIVHTFMDATMSHLALYLWMQNFRQKAADLKTGMYPLVDKMNQWKGKVGNEEQVEWFKMYQDYMKLVEVFDILAAAGLQDKNVILKMAPSHIESHQTNAVLHKHSSKAQDLQYYLTNKKPHSDPRPINLPIFGFPFEIDGWNPSEIEDQVHKIWSRFEKRDLEIALQLIKPVLNLPETEIKFPQEVQKMKGYKSLMTMTTNSSYKTMWRSISRSINLVFKLEGRKSEAQSVLWYILQSQFKYLVQPNLDPKKAEVQIENSVMFYLFIRRMGEVLEVVFKIFHTALPEKQVSKAQCMMYYWSLVLYKLPTTTYRRDQKAKWMELGLGRVYLDHLLSSRKLDKLYHKMSTTQDSDNEMSDSLSASNYSNNHSQSTTVDSPEHNENFGESSLDFTTNTIDRLSFMTARKKRTNTFKNMMNQDIRSSKGSDSSSPKRKLPMHADSEPMYLTSFHKKPRTKRIVYSPKRKLSMHADSEPMYLTSFHTKPRTKRVEYFPPSDDETEIPKHILEMREPKTEKRQKTIHSQLLSDMQNESQDGSCKPGGNIQGSEGSSRNFHDVVPSSIFSADRHTLILPDLNEPAEPDLM